MSLCINPHCPNPQNPDDLLFCQACGSELILQGRYRVIHQLGGGGFGVTFEVNEVRSHTPKVLKILINNQQKAIELFQQEANVLSQLHHSGIPKVEPDAYFVYFPRNSQNPIHCLVMEKILGMDLQKYMENRNLRPIDQTLAIQWLKELVIILEQVHKQNFFHRDIKPPNIMLRGVSGALALIDFGTARQVTPTVFNQQGGVTGVISAGYTPLEQINNNAVPQSDFFALGRTFVYLLTGKEPLEPEIYDSHSDQLNWGSYAPSISSMFADLLDEMMARFPNQRPANTQAILQRLIKIEQALNPSLPAPHIQNSTSQTNQLTSSAQVNPKNSSFKNTLSSILKQLEWSFLCTWILANTGGATVAAIILIYLNDALRVGSAVVFALLGAYMGYAISVAWGVFIGYKSYNEQNSKNLFNKIIFVIANIFGETNAIIIATAIFGVFLGIGSSYIASNLGGHIFDAVINSVNVFVHIILILNSVGLIQSFVLNNTKELSSYNYFKFNWVFATNFASLICIFCSILSGMFYKWPENILIFNTLPVDSGNAMIGLTFSSLQGYIVNDYAPTIRQGRNLYKTTYQYGWYILAFSIGNIVGDTVSNIIFNGANNSNMSFFIAIILRFSIFGAITGAVIIWILKNPGLNQVK